MGAPVDAPVIPEICIACRALGNFNALASLSVIKDAVDPVSRMALASIELPLGADTTILQVIRSELDLMVTAAMDVTCCSAADAGLGVSGWLPSDARVIPCS